MNLSLDIYKNNYHRQLKKIEKKGEPEMKIPQDLLKPGTEILKHNKDNPTTMNLYSLPPHKSLYYAMGKLADKQIINTNSGFNVVI